MKRGNNKGEKGTLCSRPVEGSPLAIYEMAAGQPFALSGGRSIPTFYFLMEGEVHIEKEGTIYQVINHEMFAVLPNRQLKGLAMSDTMIIGCSPDPEFWAQLCERTRSLLYINVEPALFRTLAIHRLLFDEIMLYVRVRRDDKLPYGTYLHLKHEQIMILLREIYSAESLASLCR